MIHKKVKVVATIGPSSDSQEMIMSLASEGVNVFRINLSHSAKEWVLDVMDRIRNAEKKLGIPLTIMGDLAGPKIRIGDVEKGVVLENGQSIEIVTHTVLGTADRISINYPSIIKQLRKNAEVYIDDGRIKLRVVKEGQDSAIAEVTVGGELLPRKGFYAEGISLDLKGLSKKDEEDLEMMVSAGTDALAISFVQSEKDIEFVRDLLPVRSQIQLVAKIETAKALENIEKIIDVSDVIMVARGDLGLAVPIAEVPHLQKKLINLCLHKAKPVITATQCLESMNTNPLPTRAEVTDVANAILDGTDAVMLSGETATGKFPVEVIKTMVKIIQSAEPHVVKRSFEDEGSVSNAISESVGNIADRIHAKLIIAFTQKGATARRISRHRHPETIIALSPEESTLHKLNFTWGVHPERIDPTKDVQDMIAQGKKYARNNKVITLEKGDPFVITAGMPFGETGSTNMILVQKV